MPAGVCISLQSDCPSVSVVSACQDVECPADQYLCHPQGCVPRVSHCNGLCPRLTNLSRGAADRVLCGNSCLSREEARNKYQCGPHCQVEKYINFVSKCSLALALTRQCSYIINSIKLSEEIKTLQGPEPRYLSSTFPIMWHQPLY